MELKGKKYFPDVCPTCENTGTYKIDGKEVECTDCDDQLSLQRRYIGSNIPIKYHRISFDDFFDEFEDLRDKVSEYVDNFEANFFYGRGITFRGPLATGKSFAASLILKELIKRGYVGLFFTFDELLDKQRASWDTLSESEWMEARDVQILVIDEITVGRGDKANDFYADSLERIIRYRTSNELPTIITTNISREQEMENFPRIFSLLSACNENFCIEGDDQRRSKIGRRTSNLAALGERRPIV